MNYFVMVLKNLIMFVIIGCRILIIGQQINFGFKFSRVLGKRSC